MSNELTLQQQGWLQLANTKTALVAQLEQNELAVQAATTLTDAKLLAKEGKDARLSFTRSIETRLFAPLMEYEKRNEAHIATLAAADLERRKQDEATAREANALTAELAQLKAHFANEKVRCESEYRLSLTRLIDATYDAALEKGELLPEAEMEKLLSGVILPIYTKFARTRVSDAQAKEIWDAATKVDFVPILTHMTETMRTTWGRFEQDKANAAAAIAARQKQAQEQEQQEKANAAAASAVNTLSAMAVPMVQPDSKVKRIMTCEVDNTPEYAALVISVFLSNMTTLSTYIKAKSWSAVTVKQMADTMGTHATKTGETFANINYTEQCK